MENSFILIFQKTIKTKKSIIIDKNNNEYIFENLLINLNNNEIAGKEIKVGSWPTLEIKITILLREKWLFKWKEA